MTKGTPSRGKHNKKPSHFICRRCGNHSYNRTRKECVSCGFGKTAKMRVYRWRKVKDPSKR
jgi:large subunit ribosomal protein L37e